MHILIAEDNLDMQKILKLSLQKDGFEVGIVSNGRDAIDFLSENQTDLVSLLELGRHGFSMPSCFTTYI